MLTPFSTVIVTEQKKDDQVLHLLVVENLLKITSNTLTQRFESFQLLCTDKA